MLRSVKKATGQLTRLSEDGYAGGQMGFKHTYWDWILGGAMLLLCAVLTVLQYQWTGELSHTEAERLRAGIKEQAQRLCNTFDNTLKEGCNALVPNADELAVSTHEATHLRHFEKWKALNPRPLYRRIAVVVPSGTDLELFEQSQTTGKLNPIEWPANWAALHDNLANSGGDGWRPFDDPTGVLMEFPIFGNRGPGGPPPDDGDMSPGNGGTPPDNGNGPPGNPGSPEKEWVVFELDTNYLCGMWFPQLVRLYLDQEGQAVSEVEVQTAAKPASMIFATARAGVKRTEIPTAILFNRLGHDPESGRIPGGSFHWKLEVRPQIDALENVVSVARRKNFAVAGVLNLLMLVTGIALVRHTRRARRLAEAQMNFVAGVSHELRTPLTVIRGAAHNLERGVVTERGQIEKYARLIIEHAGQLGDMVEQVLALAGAQKKSTATPVERVALGEVLRDAVAVTEHDTQVGQCKVQLELPPVLPPVSGDASALRRVFQNLIINAAKHGGEGKWIGITAVLDEDNAPAMVEVQVADRGRGIAAAEQKEIFKPFYRGIATRARQVRGSGLGLSLVKEIVEAHGGSISVQNADGRGAVFTVRLPVAKIKS